MGMIYSSQVITMLRRALDLVDGRLVDHGVQVAAIMKDMMEAGGIQDEELKKNLCVLSLLHDIGAYRMKEIDKLVQIETKNIWEHSVFGYLFLKEFAPFGELAKVVLYHHADYNKNWEEPEEIMKYSQLMRVADGVEVWHRSEKGEKEDELKAYLRSKTGTAFAPEAVEWFMRADEQFGTFQKLEKKVEFEEIVDCSSIEEKRVRAYLWMMVHSIDFRSRFTVTHTASVAEIGYQLAKRMGMSPKQQEQIYYGAMLHDLGKIGTPVAILEKPGRLTDEEMEVMRGHVVLSESIIKGCVGETVERIALRHHEKLDGSGYPLGISGEELTVEERILTIADIVSALCMSRSYKEAYPKDRVFEILKDMRDRGQIDGDILVVMEREYDDIIKCADNACEPIRKAHKQMGEEYKALMYKFRMNGRLSWNFLTKQVTATF